MHADSKLSAGVGHELSFPALVVADGFSLPCSMRLQQTDGGAHVGVGGREHLAVGVAKCMGMPVAEHFVRANRCPASKAWWDESCHTCIADAGLVEFVVDGKGDAAVTSTRMLLCEEEVHVGCDQRI